MVSTSWKKYSKKLPRLPNVLSKPGSSVFFKPSQYRHENRPPCADRPNTIFASFRSHAKIKMFINLVQIVKIIRRFQSFVIGDISYYPN